MNAQETFEKNYFEAIVRLAKVKNAIENMKKEFENTNKKNYGYTGSLGHVNEELKDIMNFLNVE